MAELCPSFDTLSAYFDGELAEAEMRAIRSHVATCQNCAPIISDFRGIHSTLSDLGNYQLPRSFALTESMLTPAVPKRPLARVSPFERMTRTVRQAPIIPIMTAIAALLLIAAIAGEAWSGGSSPNTAADGGTRVLMVGGVPVEVENDATFGAASAGSMNGDTPASADSAAQSSRNSIEWFNWWRPFELVLGLTVAALIVTMMSRRQPRRE
ncbi:MAG: zf-HC2 domain-containing protein [Thermomicrobiales bacterium]